MEKKKKQSSFRGKVKSDVVRQKAASSSYGYLKLPKGVQVYSPTPGSREYFDILAYIVTSTNHPDKNTETGVAVKGSEWYKRPFKTHRSVGADNDSVVCLTSFGKKCPICEQRKQLIIEGGDEQLIKDLKPSNRNLYYVIPRKNKKLEEEVHVLDFSQWNFQNLLGDEIEENEDYEVFPDLEEGFTLKVRWDEKTFMKNTFAEASRIDFLERAEAIDPNILDGLPSLDELLEELTYDQLFAKFHEIDEEDIADEDDEPEEEDELVKKKTRKKKEPEPEEEDDEPEEEDDDDEPEEEDVNLTWDDLSDMDVSELVDVIENHDLEDEVDADEFDNVEDLARAIAKELDIEVPAKKKKIIKKKASNKKENECPHGHKFGTDNDEHDECDGCKLWDACLEAS